MKHQNRLLATLLRIAAGIILVLAAVRFFLPPTLAGDPRYAAWTGFLLSLGAAAALVALAALATRQAPPEVTAALSRIQQQLMDLQVKLNDLYLITERAAHHPPSVQTPVPPPVRDYTGQFERLAALLEEIRELSLLPDADRRDRYTKRRAERRTVLIKELFDLVAAHEWHNAERHLIALETEYPNDNEVARCRSHLTHTRKLVEDETVRQTRAQVEELMSAAAWDQALARAKALCEGFPANSEARALLPRVQRERDAFYEVTVQRMFDEIRHDSERRIWRRALIHAQRLLEQFPDHRLADLVREQFPTLRDNAEIEQRQELEVRIQELIRAERYAEAVQIGEEVMRRFPLSPQADSLAQLLPRLRELAQHGAGPGGASE